MSSSLVDGHTVELVRNQRLAFKGKGLGSRVRLKGVKVKGEGSRVSVRFGQRVRVKGQGKGLGRVLRVKA
jgi:hypothetical protein